MELKTTFYFEYDTKTESGLDYKVDGEIRWDKDTKRYYYSFGLTTANDVFVEKDSSNGYITLYECIEAMLEDIPSENTLLRLIQANS